MTTPEQLEAIHQRAIVTDTSINKVLGLLDAASAELAQLVKTEESRHNQRLLSGMYQGINSERAYVAEYERANHELMADFESDDEQFEE